VKARSDTPLAAKAGVELGLPDDWLNENVRQLTSRRFLRARLQ
jgi:hypothetical protein